MQDVENPLVGQRRDDVHQRSFGQRGRREQAESLRAVRAVLADFQHTLDDAVEVPLAAARLQPAGHATDRHDADPVVGAQVGADQPGSGPEGLVERGHAGDRVDYIGEHVQQHHGVGGALRGELVDLQGAAAGGGRPVDPPLPFAAHIRVYAGDLDALAALHGGVLAEPLRQPDRDGREAGVPGQWEDGDLTESGPDGAPGQPATVVDVDIDRAERPAAPTLHGQDEIDAVRADREAVEPDPVTEGDAGVQAAGLTVVGHRDPHRHLLAFEAPPRLHLGLGRHRLRVRPTRQGEGQQHQGHGGESKYPGAPGDQRGSQRDYGQRAQPQGAFTGAPAGRRRRRGLASHMVAAVQGPLNGGSRSAGRYGLRHDAIGVCGKVCGAGTDCTISRITSSPSICRTHSSGLRVTRCARAGTATDLTSSGVT